tara:strand:+ start:66 stop:806 length:741 start_codon:yes stop_codon:yes gene_type:complete
MKIGIQILAYNCEKTIKKILEPWLSLKNKYDIKIWMGSGQFKAYATLGYPNLNESTLKLLNRFKDDGLIDELFSTAVDAKEDELFMDHEMRDKCVPWMRDNDIDLMIQVDADEFYTKREANNLIEFIKNNPDHTIYNTIFKNVVGDGEVEDWNRFSAGWIKKHGGIKEYYFDMHWYFNDEFDYRHLGSIDIPKELVNPYHYTWTNDMNTTGPGTIEGKIEYQKAIYSGGCDWEWNEDEKTIRRKQK